MKRQIDYILLLAAERLSISSAALSSAAWILPSWAKVSMAFLMASPSSVKVSERQTNAPAS